MREVSVVVDLRVLLYPTSGQEQCGRVRKEKAKTMAMAYPSSWNPRTYLVLKLGAQEPHPRLVVISWMALALLLTTIVTTSILHLEALLPGKGKFFRLYLHLILSPVLALAPAAYEEGNGSWTTVKVKEESGDICSEFKVASVLWHHGRSSHAP
jgi:hypothetical protein